MIQKANKMGRILGQAGLITLISALFFYSCDTVESDQRPIESADLSNNAIYITPSSSGIINLRSLVHANMEVVLQVSSDPQHGSLTPLGNDLIQYTKNENVTSATDAFLVSIFGGNNTFLRRDTVVIIISPDSTNVPCNGLIANTDYIDYPDSATYIDIAVLANDFFCGIDSTLVEVSIPELNLPIPYHGTVEVISDNRVRYTPSEAFDGDKFIYQITYNNEVAFGYVYLNTFGEDSSSCDVTFEAIDDVYTFSADTLGSDSTSRTAYLPVLANDVFCNEYPVKTLVTGPTGGPLKDVEGAYFYTFSNTVGAGFMDQFTYRICNDQNVCSEAVVTLKLE